MKNITQAVLAVGLLAGLCAPAAADPVEKLKAGDPAPAISIAEWVKGNATPELARGQIYLIEFWATW